jgi:hypothetical protein
MATPIKMVSITVHLTEFQAWHVAQWLKRVGFAEFR